MGWRLAAGTEHQKPADCCHEWIASRIDCGRGAQRHLRTQRKPAAWKFLSRLLAEHLRQSGMGAQARQGSYRITQRTAPSGLGMEGAGLREQLGRVAHEYLLLPAHAQEPWPVFHARRT